MHKQIEGLFWGEGGGGGVEGPVGGPRALRKCCTALRPSGSGWLRLSKGQKCAAVRLTHNASHGAVPAGPRQSTTATGPSRDTKERATGSSWQRAVLAQQRRPWDPPLAVGRPSAAGVTSADSCCHRSCFSGRERLFNSLRTSRQPPSVGP